MTATDDLTKANRRARTMSAKHPRAVSARLTRGKIKITLSNGVDFAFPPQMAQGLEQAPPESLEPIEISPSGFGLHFPKLDVDIYVPALLEGVFGSRSWMAAQLGRAGGAATSDAKAAASRENGRRGGRPRKEAATPTARRTGT
jgi:hypothetical protein